jgi:hypothetical protein
MSDNDLHDQLMLAVRDYFKYSERWEKGISDRAGIDARNALGTMRILARKRRMEIQRHRKERMAKIRNERKEK